jgi:RecA-family ATPase
MGTPLDIALDYIGRGWNPVPVDHRSKKPSTGNGWQLRIIDATNAPRYFNGGQMNIGVILGPSSHGLTDVDLDCDEARAIAPYILPRTGAIFGRASSRAAHRLYYTDLAVNTDKAVLIFDDPTTRGRMLELRIGGASGAQTVFPGSTHKETGEPITWEETGEPASIDGDDLARRIHELAAYSLIARYWPTPGLKARHQAALIVGGFLARAGKSAGDIKVTAEAIARAANDNEWRNRREAAEDAAKAFHAGQHAYGLTGMRQQFGQEIADQIAEWLGYDYNSEHGPETSTKSDNWRANVISAADLEHKTFARLVEIVPKLIVEGLTILAGRPKVGKSWKALDLSLGVAGGREVLGGIMPISGDVLYCALEDTQRRLQSRTTRLIGYNKEEPWPARLQLATNWRRLDEGGVDDIAAWADSVSNPRLVVLDTLAGARPQRNAGEQLYDSDYKALVGLQKLAGEKHFAALVLHHTRKMEADDPLDTVSGTLGLTGCADTVMVINRTTAGTTLYIRGRDIEEGEYAIVFDKSTCRWQLMGDASEVHLSDANKKILEILLAAPAPMRADTIASLVKLPRERVDTYIGRLVHSGQVIRFARGEYIHAQRSDLLMKR